MKSMGSDWENLKIQLALKGLTSPYVNYCIIVWGQTCTTHLHKILMQQKRSLRFIYSTKQNERAIVLFVNSFTFVLPPFFESVGNRMPDVRNNILNFANIQILFVNVSCIHSYRTHSSISKTHKILSKIIYT